MKPPLAHPPSLRAAVMLAIVAGLLVPAALWLAAELVAGNALGNALERHRAAVLLMVAVQGVATAALTLWVLTRRLTWPLERLAEQIRRD